MPNPYAQAADAYGLTAAETDPRALEARVLLKAAQKLEELSKRLAAGEKPTLDEIGETLVYNRKLWQLFVEDMMNPGHLLPQEIKNNVASLGVFVFKRTNEILTETTPDKFKILVDINRNIAAGLMKKPALSAPAPLPAGTVAAPKQQAAPALSALDSLA
jgi:flagellar protein FlaF